MSPPTPETIASPEASQDQLCLKIVEMSASLLEEFGQDSGHCQDLQIKALLKPNFEPLQQRTANLVISCFQANQPISDREYRISYVIANSQLATIEDYYQLTFSAWQPAGQPPAYWASFSSKGAEDSPQQLSLEQTQAVLRDLDQAMLRLQIGQLASQAI